MEGDSEVDDQQIFHNFDDLIKKHNVSFLLVFFGGLVLGGIFIIFHLVILFLPSFFIVYGILELNKKNRVNALKQRYEAYRNKLMNIETKITDEYLSPYYKRYNNIEEFQANKEKLLHLINTKNKFHLSIDDLNFISRRYEDELLTEYFLQGIKALKVKDEKSLSTVFMTAARPEIRDCSECDEKNICNRCLLDFYVDILDNLKIDYQKELFIEEVKNTFNELKAGEFEKELKSCSPKRKGDILSTIDKMSGYEFESYISKLLIGTGSSVKTTAKSHDHGADVIVEKNGIKTAIQIKKYAGKVGNKAVQEVVASKKIYNCEKAMVITTGEFTKEAIKLAEVNDVSLIDGKKLHEFISLNEKMANFID